MPLPGLRPHSYLHLVNANILSHARAETVSRRIMIALTKSVLLLSIICQTLVRCSVRNALATFMSAHVSIKHDLIVCER